MTLTLKALASGSSGNGYLLQAEGLALLIDCGLAARTITTHLRRYGVEPSALAAILLTHEHHDHVLALGTLSRHYGVPVVANGATLDAAEALVGPICRHALPTGGRLAIGPLQVSSFPVPHDAAEPVGYLVRDGQHAICLATDLGTPLPELAEPLGQADLIVLEANHEPTLLHQSQYPAVLKSRILGDRGHLSNQQAAELLVGVAARSSARRPRSVWLAHLSDENNHPKIALAAVGEHLRAQAVEGFQLGVALRDRPSLSWSPSATGVQGKLF